MFLKNYKFIFKKYFKSNFIKKYFFYKFTYKKEYSNFILFYKGINFYWKQSSIILFTNHELDFHLGKVILHRKSFYKRRFQFNFNWKMNFFTNFILKNMFNSILLVKRIFNREKTFQNYLHLLKSNFLLNLKKNFFFLNFLRWIFFGTLHLFEKWFLNLLK